MAPPSAARFLPKRTSRAATPNTGTQSRNMVQRNSVPNVMSSSPAQISPHVCRLWDNEHSKANPPAPTSIPATYVKFDSYVQPGRTRTVAPKSTMQKKGSFRRVSAQ